MPTNDIPIFRSPSPETPRASVAWWIAGSIAVGVSLAAALTGGLRTCAGNISCQFNSLLQLSMGMLGMFAGAVLIVVGFQVRSKARTRAEEEAYQRFLAHVATITPDTRDGDEDHPTDSVDDEQ